jgi:hypothetical protein
VARLSTGAAMTKQDLGRLRRLINLADKFGDALADAERRGLVGDWKAHGDLRLSSLVNEFHDWQCAKLGDAEAAAEKAST